MASAHTAAVPIAEAVPSEILADWWSRRGVLTVLSTAPGAALSVVACLMFREPRLHKTEEDTTLRSP